MFLGLLLAVLTQRALAWDVHQTLMPFILESIAQTDNPLTRTLLQTHPVPCKEEDQITLKILITSLGLSQNTQISPSGTCGGPPISTALLLLQQKFVDDPDAGMDRNLPADQDPKQIRTWMGGATGPSSQGFRHMYFESWNPIRPMTTLHFPPQSMGEAPRRAELMAQKAREFRQKNWGFWSVRLLGWALHYVQDLAQPFHSVQWISTSLVPWFELFKWPIENPMTRFRQQTNRTITNYHWAYEGYTRIRLKETASPFQDCLKNPHKYSKFNMSTSENPQDIAKQVATESSLLAAELGVAELAFFGPQYLEAEYDIAHGQGTIDYAYAIARPDKSMERQRLNEVTCKALAIASLGSQKLMHWVLVSK